MSQFLFVTWDGGGNVPPALGIAEELKRRGHRVRFLGHPQQRTVLQSAGFEFLPFRTARPWSPLTAAAGLRGALHYGRMFTDRGMGIDLKEHVATDPPDLLVVDALLLGALDVALGLGLPSAALVHTYQQYLVTSWSRGPIGLLAKAHRLSPKALWDGADLVLVAADPLLDPGSRSRLPANVRHVGVVQPEPLARKGHQDEQRAVLISLSTNYFPGQQQTLQTVLDGLAELPVRLLVTTGAVAPEELRAPPNAQLHQTCPHTTVMPEVQAVVGHGGHATTMLALAHDLPLVVLPMHPMLDQKMVGQSVAEQGAGILLTRKASAQQIRNAVQRVLDEAPFSVAAARVGTELRSKAAASIAADELLARTPRRRLDGISG